MTKPLSSDLRERLVAAVEDGMSCREAAEQFGVAPSSAVKIVGCWRKTGSFKPRPQGGDRRSAPSAIWRLLARHDETYKKKLVRQRAGASRRRRGAPGLVGGTGKS